MANTFLTPTVIAQQALATLYESTVMAQLVHRDYSAEFARKIGDTITVRKPAVFVANEFVRTTGIVVQDATETGFPVVLNHFADVSFAVTSEDMALRIEDFEGQLLGPAMEAISQKIDRDLMLLRNDITQVVGTAPENAAGQDYNGYAGNYPWSDSRVLIQAGKVLSQRKVPTTERRVAMGPETAARYKAEKVWRQSDFRGSTEGLLEANLGPRVAGFDPYETQNIQVPAPQGVGISTTEVDIAFHKTAFALVTRPLELPKGAVNAAVMSYKGFGLRVIYGYDQAKKQDVVSIDCLYGTKTLDANRAVLIKGVNG
ncbi:MAG: hypothetical protein H0X35_13645 [Pseudonocardiales bacterium]|nr:hypothetical protein [Pseudonocardiales bacterium]